MLISAKERMLSSRTNYRPSIPMFAIVCGMNRSLLVRIVACAFVLLCAWAGYTQNQKPARPLRIEKVKDDLFMVAGEGGNVAVYVTNEGVVLVDDMFDRNHNDILAQVKSVTDKPLRYVLNTHQHDDHAGGDAAMLPIAEVIAHRNARSNLVAKKQPYYEDTPGTPIGLPRITFSDETAVYLGGKEVRAGYYGRGHTNGDAIIYFPQGRSHRRPVSRPGGRWPRSRNRVIQRDDASRSGADSACRREHLHRFRAGRQLSRMDDDSRQGPQDRL